ncbi:MAG: class I SAM-dependent methyltransferase [Desulfobacterales bacterium]|nr:class I SAM-dependent methyltransferase [Desulfobacterales bacterium]
MNIQKISTGLRLGDDGIWHSRESESVSYPSEGNDSCFAIEENSFWFKHRNNCIASVVKSYPPENNGTIFDVGGGNGFVSLGLANSGFNVALVEPGATGASIAKKRGISDVICATTNTAGFKQHSLPAVGLFDVIEHIEGDLDFLKSIRDLIEKNGRLYATVPAFSFLWSAEDVAAGHFRRYTLDEISRVLQLAGFQVEFSSYFFRILPIPIFVFRALPYKLGLSGKARNPNAAARDHATKAGVVTNVLNSILRSEIDSLDNGKAMSFGGSCVIVAKAP